MNLPVVRIEWKPCWRIIPSRFPPIDLFERVGDPDDPGAIHELESLTNPRLRDEVGDLRLVPAEDRVSGPGSSAIMAAFTHLNPEGGRFSDGSWGVFHAGCDLMTAIAETRHHRERFLRNAGQTRIEFDMRVYAVDLDGELHDLRGRKSGYPPACREDSHAAGRHLAEVLRREGSNGIVHDSVRRDGGECAAVFRPRLLSNCRQERHLCYVWDGERVTDVYEKRALEL